MRSQKALLMLLKELVSLIADEAEKNPDFASRLDQLLEPLNKPNSPKQASRSAVTVPDVYAEFKPRNESDFKVWLGKQPIPVLRAIIRKHDFDATKRVSRSKDTSKLVELITEQIRARLARGSGFLTPPSS